MELRLKPVSRLSCRRCPHGLAESLFIISFSRSDSSHTVEFRAASRSAASRSESRKPYPKMLFFAARWLSSAPDILALPRRNVEYYIAFGDLVKQRAAAMTCDG